MGGYGGKSGRQKDKCYLNTAGMPVKDANAIFVAEHYLHQEKYVAFWQKCQMIIGVSI